MRVAQFFACAIAVSAVHAVSLPNSNALDLLEEHAGSLSGSNIMFPEHALEKRKGGGGKGGGGGSSGGKIFRASTATGSSGRLMT